MKFSFKIAIIFSSLCFAFGQNGGYGREYQPFYYESYPNSYQNSYPTSNQNSYQVSNQNSFPNRNSQYTQNSESAPTSLSLSSCDSYWTVQRDYNGAWGQLSIPSPNKEQAMIKVAFTLAADLPNVSN